MIQQSGASHDIELLFFLGCAEDGLFTAALADGFVSAMTQLIFGLKNYSWLLKNIPAILLKIVLKKQNNLS
ncbi:MAG TPA: hypothetical protein VF408_08535 [Sediminibacterium sp.]|jgi:hypothetical protein